jgi:hypothetical protein
MRLQDRDTLIIEYLNDYKGATIDQISKLYFKGSYEACKKRLAILENNKYIKGSWHEILGKKVYYTVKIPSFHKIITNDIRILLMQSTELIDFKTEVKINNYKIDALCVYKLNGMVKILIVEVDIFNRTKEEKLNTVKEELKKKTGVIPSAVVVGMHARRDKTLFVKVGELEKLLLII